MESPYHLKYTCSECYNIGLFPGETEKRPQIGIKNILHSQFLDNGTLLERELFFCIVFWFQPVPGLPRTSIAFRCQNPASPLATAIPPHCVSVRSEHLK